MVRRGRKIAAFLGVLAAALVAVGALGSRQALVEEWYVWKLRSADRVESDLAAAKLAELDSLHAVEPLVLAIRRDAPEAISVSVFRDSRKGESRIPLRLELPPKAHALYRLGRKALPAIERTLKEEDQSPDPAGFVLFHVRDAIQGQYAEVISKPGSEPPSQSHPPLTSPSRCTRSPPRSPPR
jgi:hypothetical protein